MKILFSHYLLDDDNPPVRTIQAISHCLRELGHEVQVHRSFGEVRPGLHTHGIGDAGRKRGAWLRNRAWFLRASVRNLRLVRRDLAALREFRPDVVLVRHDAYCVSMALAARRARVPLVTYADLPAAYEQRLYHGRARWHPPGIVEAIERRALRDSLAVIATSHPTAAKIENDYGLGLETTVVPNGLHPERFPELDPGVRESLRRELGIDRPNVLGFQGTFKPFHGIDRLRDLMLATAARGDVHWLLVGDGPMRAELQEAIGDRVPATFLGRRPADEMGRWLGLMDVAVAPHEFVKGIFYLSPLKIIEYAASGCAVVASRQGDIPWLLDNGRAGVLVDDPEIAAWSDAVSALLDKPAERAEMGRRAREYVMEQFTWARIASQYAEVMARALERDAQARPDAAGRLLEESLP